MVHIKETGCVLLIRQVVLGRAKTTPPALWEPTGDCSHTYYSSLQSQSASVLMSQPPVNTWVVTYKENLTHCPPHLLNTLCTKPQPQCQQLWTQESPFFSTIYGHDPWLQMQLSAWCPHHRVTELQGCQSVRRRTVFSDIRGLGSGVARISE